MENLKKVIGEVRSKAKTINEDFEGTLSKINSDIAKVNEEIDIETKKHFETIGNPLEHEKSEEKLEELLQTKSKLEKKKNSYVNMDIKSFFNEDWQKIKDATIDAAKNKLLEMEKIQEEREKLDTQIKELQKKEENLKNKYVDLSMTNEDLDLIESVINLIPVGFETFKFHALEQHLKYEIIRSIISDKELTPYIKERLK